MQFFSRGVGACRVRSFLLAASIFLALPAAAQWYTVLQTFEKDSGANPLGTLARGSDGSFYGTMSSGGPGGAGGVFHANSYGFVTPLRFFSGSDGGNPVGGLARGTDGDFYGTTMGGGTSGMGTVFRIAPGGTLTTLHAFMGTDGATPRAPLVQGTDGNFYGTTSSAGANGTGTVFRITPAGTLTTLTSFAAVGIVPIPSAATGGLVQAPDGNFYGTTIGGGAGGAGTVFRITPAGLLTTLHSFTGTDGGGPVATLVLGGDGNFYGTTNWGGTGDLSLPVIARAGTFFRITPAGTLTTLHSFAGSGGQLGGAVLAAGNDGNFWGTTATGGRGCGTAFRMTPDGTLTTLVDLPGSWSDGCAAFGGLAQGTDGNFYGTTSLGGRHGDGVLFRLARDPEMFLPVVLDDVPGIGSSRYTTELTLSSKAATPIAVTLFFAGSADSGTGSISVTLAAGETRIFPNAIAFLRAQGLTIPPGATIGTLRATFVGANPLDSPFVGARTYTTGGGGTFGVFYPASTARLGSVTLLGLQQNTAQRSNIALVNPGPTLVTLQVHLFGPLGEDLGSLPTWTLPPYGWGQFNAPLEGKATSGRAVVTGGYPFAAYAVLNDAVTSDGSFIAPIFSVAGGSSLVPVVLDAHGVGGTHYTTELTLTNLTTGYVPLTLAYEASLGTGSGQITYWLAPGEQQIVPDTVAFLRSQGLAIPADGSNAGGSLLVSGSAFVGARTSTPNPSGGGTFGTYYPSLTAEEWAVSVAYVNGLQQSSSQRSNLAVVNAGDAADAITLSVSYVDGTGAALGTPTSVTLAPGQWMQFNQPLAALGAASGYARIEKTSGGSRFVAYGILNDAVTSDGSYIPMSF